MDLLIPILSLASVLFTLAASRALRLIFCRRMQIS